LTIFLFIVYSKSEYTIGSVSVPGRIHDNSSKANPIVMKFCAWNRLIDISVEFEDENDWSTPSWFMAKKCDYSCGPIPRSFSQRKTQVPPNRPKGILSCRAWKVVTVVKKSAINIVPLGRYRSHSFSWKSRKFVKNQKNYKICKFCGLEFSSYYMVKNQFQIYIHVRHELAHLPTCFFFILHLYKIFFLRHTGDLWQKRQCSHLVARNSVKLYFCI